MSLALIRDMAMHSKYATEVIICHGFDVLMTLLNPEN